MKIRENRFIPFKGFNAINIFGVVFVRYGAAVSERTIRHESIHTAQMKEMLYILFYLWYVVEWFVKLFIYKDSHKAYKNISFEREAFDRQNEIDYCEYRKKYAWIRYLKQP